MSENTITTEATEATAGTPLIQLTDVSATEGGCCGGGSCGA